MVYHPKKYIGLHKNYFQLQKSWVSLTDYKKGQIKDFDFVFYVGDRKDAVIPDTFLDDVSKYQDVTVVWLQWNMNQLLAKHDAVYGFKAAPARSGG